MPDERTTRQKYLDGVFGMPLYYCESCFRAVQVTEENGAFTIKRPCGSHCASNVIAPRRAIASGDGKISNLPATLAIKLLYWRVMSMLTRRCV